MIIETGGERKERKILDIKQQKIHGGQSLLYHSGINVSYWSSKMGTCNLEITDELVQESFRVVV